MHKHFLPLTHCHVFLPTKIDSLKMIDPFLLKEWHGDDEIVRMSNVQQLHLSNNHFH